MHKLPETRASEMEHAIRYEISIRLQENPVVYRSLKERLEELIKAKEQERIELTELIEEYGKLILKIRDVYKGVEAKKVGMTDDEFAFYGIIKDESKQLEENTLKLNEEKLKIISKDIFKKLEDLAVIDFRRKRSVLKNMRAEIRKTLVMEGWNKDNLDKITARIMELAEVRL